MKTRKTDNEVIAEFDGWVKNPEINKGSRIQWIHPKYSTKLSDTLSIPTTPENMKYHSSWDWLMPVVEKIQDVEIVKNRVVRTCAEVTIYYKACKIEYFPDEDSGDEHDQFKYQTQGKTKLEAVYKAVVEFIKWVE